MRVSRTSPLPAPKGNDVGAIRSLIVFRLADQLYALPRSAIREVLPLPRLARPPGAPAALAGFLNLEGTAVPVVRLGRLFDLPAVPDDIYSPLLLLASPREPTALLIDEVRHVVSASSSDILPVSELQSFHGCATGILRLDDRMLVVLDPERLLLEWERRALADLRSLEERRLSAWETAAP